MRHFLYFPCLAILLGACADYQFTVNERVVYTPAPLYTDYDIPDEALRECIKQHVRDGSVTAAGQLNDLNCSHAGIESLVGLDTFSGLQRLKLSSNAIGDLAPLSTLDQLTEVRLDGNRLRSLTPLRGLSQLSFLDLQGNPALNCQDVAHFAAVPQLTLESPRHCSG